MSDDLYAETSLVRELVRKSTWDTLYHEHELRRAHHQLAVAKMTIVRCFPEIDVANIMPSDEDPPDADDPADFMRNAVAQAAGSVLYNEDGLCKAHEALALAKAIARRGGYAIDFSEIMATETQRARDNLWAGK